MGATSDDNVERIEVSEDQRPTVSGSDGGGRQFLYFAVGALVLAMIGVGSFLALSSGSHVTVVGDGEGTPVIHADNRPFKVRPDDPGGLEVPHRDKLVYSRLKGVAEAPEVERLLPDPEKPLPPPEEPSFVPSEATTTTPVTGTAPAEAPAEAAAALAGAPADAPPPADRDAVAVPDNHDAAPASTAVAGLPPPTKEDADALDKVVEDADATSAQPMGTMIVPVARPVAYAGPRGASTATAKLEPASTALASAAGSPKEPGSGHGGPKYLVQLGAMSSPELAHAQWVKLLAGNADVLGRLKPTIARADLGDKGTLYRLRAGPLDGAERAEEVCTVLSGRSIGCIVVSFSG